MKKLHTFEEFVNESRKVDEGFMSELDITRQESKTLNDFIKNAKSDFKEIAKMKDADEFLKELWDLGKQMNEDSLNEGYQDKLKDIHFETDPKKQIDLKIAYGKSTGEVTITKQIETADYMLRKFRKDIKYGDGSNVEVFVPGTYDAVTSRLGDGPHAKKRQSIRWNKKEYDKWVKDMSGNGGAEHAFDMAQNAKQDPSLLDYVRKNNPGEDPLQVIQWAIEAYA